MITVLAVVAGGLGACARFVVDGSVSARVRARHPSALPWGTSVINLTGAAVLGLITGLVMAHSAPTEVSLVAGTGFLGGYTTFSTASVETLRLLQESRPGAAAVHALVNLVGSLALAGVGMVLGTLS